MQTFLPYADFDRTAQVLDRLRLGKQRLETWQILHTLSGRSFAWDRHPAVVMWRGHGRALATYGMAVCQEWRKRGYRDSLMDKIAESFLWFPPEQIALPSWMGREDFHLSHQSNLVRKDAKHYGPLFPGVPADLPYVWPVAERSSTFINPESEYSL